MEIATTSTPATPALERPPNIAADDPTLVTPRVRVTAVRPCPPDVARARIMAEAAQRARRPRTLVERDVRPYWVQRGWSLQGGQFVGLFRSPIGQFSGRATISASGRVEPFIRNPPPQLRQHPGWHCFYPRDDNWYFIHVTREEPDLSDCIRWVEGALRKVSGQ